MGTAPLTSVSGDIICPVPGCRNPPALLGSSSHWPLLLLLWWQRKDILAELSKSQKVFSEKLDHLSRRLAWVHAAVYSQVSRVASARGCSLRQLTDWPLTGPGGAAPWCPLPSWASGTHLTLPAPQAPSHPVS